MTQATFDNRKTITYAGDATGSIGEIKGPNDNGELLIIDEAVFTPPVDCYLTTRPNTWDCHDPQCGDSTWDHECPTGPCVAREHTVGVTRVWLRFATGPEVTAAADLPQPDMATPPFDLPTWLVGPLGYVDVTCDGCGETTRQHGISNPSKAWALCPDCLSKPWAQARVEAKRREIHEDAKAAQQAGIEDARPDVDATGTRSPVTIFIVGQANKEPGPFDRTWLVEYDPTRPGTAPDGRQMTAHIAVTTNRDEAARYPDALSAWAEWKRESGLPYPRNAPLTAFAVAFTPEDIPEVEVP